MLPPVLKLPFRDVRLDVTPPHLSTEHGVIESLVSKNDIWSRPMTDTEVSYCWPCEREVMAFPGSERRDEWDTALIDEGHNLRPRLVVLPRVPGGVSEGETRD